ELVEAAPIDRERVQLGDDARIPRTDEVGPTRHAGPECQAQPVDPAGGVFGPGGSFGDEVIEGGQGAGQFGVAQHQGGAVDGPAWRASRAASSAAAASSVSDVSDMRSAPG